MNVSLTPKLKKYVEKRVKSGDYGTASEVIREGLRLLQSRDMKLEYLRDEVAKGWNSLEEGRGISVTSDELRKLLRRNISSRKKKSA